MGRRAITTLALGLAVLVAGPPCDAEESTAPGAEMTTYQLVLLYRGADRTPMGEREIVKLQEEHLGYLSDLLEAGDAVVFGPVDGGEDLRGIVVLDVGSVEAAEEAMRRDPWVRAGRVRAEVHPWWTRGGAFREPRNILHQETCYLGLLLRPGDAPELGDERLREIQAGHLENIRGMADSGLLLLAGPMGDDGKLRGILLFRSADPGRIREAVAADPAVKAGRLGMELYPWNVPKGSLPAP